MLPTEVVAPRPAPHLPGRTLGQRSPVHVERPPGHGRAGVDVLRDSGLHEPVTGDDRDFGLVDAVDPAEVVTVGMGVDDGGHRPVPAVRAVEGESGGGTRRGDQGVDDDDPVVGLDHGHVREIQAPDLVDAIGDLVETLTGRELRLAPQARVDGIGAIRRQEPEGVVVPDLRTVGSVNDARLERTDQSTVGVFVVGSIVEVSSGHAFRSFRTT